MITMHYSLCATYLACLHVQMKLRWGNRRTGGWREWCSHRNWMTKNDKWSYFFLPNSLPYAVLTSCILIQCHTVLSCDNLVTISELNRNEMNICDIFRRTDSRPEKSMANWLLQGQVHTGSLIGPYRLLGSKVYVLWVKQKINHPPNHHN